jgi:hypothetical protein
VLLPQTAYFARGTFLVRSQVHPLRKAETEKALLGTIHIGFGNNDEYPGGMVRSEVHVDGGARHATVEVDGRVILQEGRLAV